MGLGFSQTFALDRSILSSALRALHANPGITDFCKAFGLGKEGAKNKHLVSDIGIFLQAYTKPEGLQALDYLRKRTDESYRRGDIAKKVHPLLVAYVIYAQRERRIQTSTLAIRSLLNDDCNVGKVYLMDRDILLEKLRQLEVEGLVRISQEADLDNIAYTYTQ